MPRRRVVPIHASGPKFCSMNLNMLAADGRGAWQASSRRIGDFRDTCSFAERPSTG